jgi:hypothetical protein
METWTVQVPARIHKQLQQRALSEGKTPQAVALEILEHDLSAPGDKTESPNEPAPAVVYDTERERYAQFHRTLREQGLLRPLSPELQKLIIPNVDREEVVEAMTQAGGKSLSEIVIEQRQERHDSLVYGHQRARKKVHPRKGKQASRTSHRRKKE